MRTQRGAAMGRRRSGASEDFTQEELEQFYSTIGRMMFNAPAACLFARHVNPMSTVRDYLVVKEPGIDHVRLAARRFVLGLARISAPFSFFSDRSALSALKRFATEWHGPNPAGRSAAKIAADMPGLDDK